jgi:hypothetical protein
MVYPMKKMISYVNIFLLLFLLSILHAQNDKSKIVGVWEFQTITSIYYSSPQETLTTNRSNYQQETLTFRENGTFSYYGFDEGSKYASIGIWNAEKSTITMDANGIKTFCEYKVSGDMMTLSVKEEESEEYYKTFSVLKYKNKITNR